MAFSAQLHPRAPVGSAAGGQFAAKGGSSSSTTTTAAAKKPAPAKGKTAKKTAPTLTPKQAQTVARSVPFAELKRLTTLAHKGKPLTPAQRAIVAAGEASHANHLNHNKQLAAKAKVVKPKAKATVKKATVKKTTAVKPKATAKTATVASRL